MEAYQLENALVEQRNDLHRIRKYVEGEAQDDQLHEVEENIFRMLLTYGRNFGTFPSQARTRKNGSVGSI